MKNPKETESRLQDYMGVISFYHIYELAGDQNKDIRQNIVEIVTGQKLPKAKCGIHFVVRVLMELHEYLYGKNTAMTGIDQERHIYNWLKRGN